MNRIARLLIVTLLLAGLPLRGYASVMMAGAMLRHHAPAPQAMHASAAQEAHAGHDHAHMRGAHHGAAAQDAPEAAPPHAAHMAAQLHPMHMTAPLHAMHMTAPDQRAGAGNSGDVSTHGAKPCVTCGDCCSVGAPQSVTPMLTGHAPVTHVATSSLPQPASFLADLPVPPPNLLPA
jgi:hypothetical protein